MNIEFYIGTVCLERNRWGSRQPSFAVSDWLPRFKADGFDGVELWEFHFLAADEDEQARLARSAAPLAIYNSYAGFTDDAADQRARAADAARRLNATAVKYNFGYDADQLAVYRSNLLQWAEQLPVACRLLCECHEGTALASIDDAAAFFADLDPERFGVMVHPLMDPAQLERWFTVFGPRLQHLHLQMRSPETDPAVAANRQRMDACLEVVRSHGFEGSAAIEFTRGIGRDEELETLYANALVDMAYCRKQLA